MLNFKSNVYKNEWLELVFADRNKLYGAYELRQGYSSRLVKALLLSVSLFVSVIMGPFLYDRFIEKASKPITSVLKLDKVDTLSVYLMPKAHPKSAAPPIERISPPMKVKTTTYIPFKPVPPGQVTVEAPTKAELQNVVIGSQTVEGASVSPGTNAIETGNGTATSPGAAEVETNQPFINAEHMPEFPGGMDAFGKYLSKNLHYPSQAQDNNIQGRVTVSFIVETNGSLSDIHVVRGIGAGCDEEAVRVLKKAPAWRPGEQNGRKVRVMYNVPIVFNLGD